MLAELNRYGIPADQYKVEIGEDAKSGFFYMKLTHKKTAVRIQIDQIIAEDNGDVIQYNHPELRGE